MSNLEYYINSLTEFHETFLQPVVKSYADCRYDKLKLRKTLIFEEFEEYTHAKNRIDKIDALGDLLYVTVGTMITTGVKAEEYRPAADNKPRTSNLLQVVYKMLGVLIKDQPCYRSLWDATTVLYWQINNESAILGFDLKEAFRRIHESNMTKAWTEEDLKEDFDEKLMTEEFRPTLSKWVVMRKSDGKVLKPRSYRAVDLAGL